MLYLLAPEKNPEAINIIKDSVNNILPRYGALGIREWKLKDCISYWRSIYLSMDIIVRKNACLKIRSF
jgi:hypothetical protein